MPGFYRGELRATGYPDTMISDKDPEVVIKVLVRGHRIAVQCRRAERRKRSS